MNGGKQPVYTVAQVNSYIKAAMDKDPILSGLFIRGEISNFKTYPSGHSYFSLKDEGGSIRCVMFRREASRLRFRPENGMKVIAFGRITVFPRDGQYQLYCGELTPEGAGDLHVAFEQLKEKLFREGLFDASHKKPLPRYPERIALVTSPAGAALRDMLRILGARYPLASVVLLPVRVQGAGAPEEIAAALRYASAHRIADLVITGRGGGSIEDLWAFNEEIVARAIYDCKIPVISAVGHEPDVTIADFVADLRAATPSEAAERAVFDFQQFLLDLDTTAARIKSTMVYRVRDAKRREEHLRQQMRAYSPANRINEKLNRCGVLEQRLADRMEAAIKDKKNQLGLLAGRLEGVSPAKKLSQGYACVTDEKGKRVSDGGDLQAGDLLRIYFRKGGVKAEVKEKIEGLIYGREE